MIEQPSTTELDELRRRVSDIHWFHSIDLGNGIVTPGDTTPARRLLSFGIPEDLTGKSVLDIGAWDGFFSFEAERRGAARVVAADYFSWAGGGWGTKAGFDLAREALQSKVQDVEIDVMDLSPAAIGTFDIVFFFGVLYHLRHPLLALEKVASVTSDVLLLETVVDLTELERPAMAFYPADELNNDASNWFGPNENCIAAMLRDVGFKQVEVHSRTYSTEPPVNMAESLRVIRGHRAVFHTRK